MHSFTIAYSDELGLARSVTIQSSSLQGAIHAAWAAWDAFDAVYTMESPRPALGV